MYIKNSQQDIFIEFPEYIKNIGIKLSGGLDSAFMLYIVCKYINDEQINTSIVPITIEKSKVKFHYKFSELVINFCKKEFPNVIFKDHKKINQYLNIDHNTTQHIFVDQLRKQKVIDSHFSGVTANPPEDIIFKSPDNYIFDPPPERIYKGKLKTQILQIKNNYYLHQPFVNIDKKGIYELYKKFNLLDSLFLLTRSCENQFKEKTNNYTTHCKNYCWDCFERKWGFGIIDNKFDLEI